MIEVPKFDAVLRNESLTRDGHGFWPQEIQVITTPYSK